MIRRIALAAAIAFAATPASSLEMTDAEAASASRELLFGHPMISDAAVARLRARGEEDVLPILALAMRYRGPSPILIEAAGFLAKEPIRNWADLMLWIETQDDFKPHPSYTSIKLDMARRIDPAFERFLGGDLAKPENMDIRPEEIVWGGVPVDGIPALDNPQMIGAGEADYLKDDDLVFGVEIDGDARAYPLRIMGWHEMANDVVGGVPIAIAYCTLCGAAILFDTAVDGWEKPFVFGSSGFLYRSNKLMFDRETDSLWNQFTGRPVSGPLRGSGIGLNVRPIATTSWGRWKAAHPDTKVLSLETGHRRDYGSGVVYKEYFSSPDLMFPTRVGDESVVKRKDVVFGVRGTAASRAWPVKAFENEPVINDVIGGQTIVLIGDADTRTVRAYERKNRTFAEADDGMLTDGESQWSVSEAALIGPDGARLSRIPGHLSYWFAWDGYFGAESTVYISGSN